MPNINRNQAALLGGALLTVGLITGVVHLPNGDGGTADRNAGSQHPFSSSDEVTQSLRQMSAQLVAVELEIRSSKKELVSRLDKHHQLVIEHTGSGGGAKGHSPAAAAALEAAAASPDVLLPAVAPAAAALSAPVEQPEKDALFDCSGWHHKTKPGEAAAADPYREIATCLKCLPKRLPEGLQCVANRPPKVWSKPAV